MVVAAHLFYIFFVFFSSAFLTGISFCRCLSFSPVETTPPLHFSSPQKKKRSSINSANSSTPSIKTRKTYFFLFQKSSQSPVLHGHHVIIAKRVDRFVNRQIPAGSPLKKKQFLIVYYVAQSSPFLLAKKKLLAEASHAHAH